MRVSVSGACVILPIRGWAQLGYFFRVEMSRDAVCVLSAQQQQQQPLLPQSVRQTAAARPPRETAAEPPVSLLKWMYPLVTPFDVGRCSCGRVKTQKPSRLAVLFFFKGVYLDRSE